MPTLKTYDLFISHAWNYNKDYYALEKLLSSATLFKYRNYSVPEHDPVIDPNSESGRRKLSSALHKQIRPVNCMLVIAGMYVNYKYWIQKEMEIAGAYNKPLVGIIPWGQERIPRELQNSVIELVGWNTHSIVDAIRRNSL